jgi:Flp pilus assembly protein TadG
MINRSPRSSRRYGTAAVEMAVVAIPIFIFMAGTWELGRLIQVDQIVTNAAREGARTAASGAKVNTFGQYVYVIVQPPTTVAGYTSLYVSDIVNQYLIGAGITNTNNVQVTFTNQTTPANNQPYLSKKGELFEVDVAVPYNNFRWTQVTLINPGTITAKVRWAMLVNAPFNINTNIPDWTGTQAPAGP